MTQPGMDAAKLGHTLSRLTMSLFYATDFADRLENAILPALKAGFYVLSDRYLFSIIARDIVRGANYEWARRVYGFALKPDIVLYLKTDVPHLVSRMVYGRGFDYWESGMDFHFAENLYDSFCKYQELMIEEYDRMAKEFGFITIDANRSITEVFEDLKNSIRPLMEEQSS